MNQLEAIIYNIIKKNPKLKTIVRDIYQQILYYVPVKKVKCNYQIKVRSGFFFGFHDKTPFSRDNKFMLAMKYHTPLRTPLPEDYVEIGYFTGENFSEFKALSKTNTYNWQQGCMLQWVGNKNLLAYNAFDGKKNCTEIIDMNGTKIAVLPAAVGAICPSGEYALSYNFARLAKYAPGYGYATGNDYELHKNAPETHGLHIINIKTKVMKTLFTIKDIVKLKPDDSMPDSYHYFTHPLFSPCGKRFFFLHRWIKNMNFTFTRLITCDIDKINPYILPASGMVSHIGWRDDNHILAYCHVKEGDHYVLFEDKTDKYEIIGDNCFNSDGHPSFSPVDINWLLTDTYPDRFKLSFLILFNMQDRKRYNIARLKQPIQYREELRCDLHPRWSRNGRILCFDSAHTGNRALCTIDMGMEFTKRNFVDYI